MNYKDKDNILLIICGAVGIAALALVFRVGIYWHKNVKKIEIKAHKRKAKSIFRYGLDYIKTILLNPCRIDQIDVVKFWSCI